MYIVQKKRKKRERDEEKPNVAYYKKSFKSSRFLYYFYIGYHPNTCLKVPQNKL